MVTSKALNVEAYIEELPEDKKIEIEKARALILKNLPKGYQERMQYGMISYVVPLEAYPKGYLGRKDEPLPYLSLAAQKNYQAIYFMCLYADSEGMARFVENYKATGKKLNMGKSCVRFKKFDDLPTEVIADAIAQTSVPEMIEFYEKM